MIKDLLRHSVDRAALLRRLDRNPLKEKEKIGGLRSPMTYRYHVVNVANMSAELITAISVTASDRMHLWIPIG